MVDQYDWFFFEKNLQGDIIAVYNSTGTKIGSYTYDAWGNHTYSTTSGTTGLERKIVTTYNPFRYRGYFYDVETQWYYLQSRYYNPNWGRFISADGYVSTGTGLLGYNMYVYCNNNPVMYLDYSGESFLGFLLLTTLFVAPTVILMSTVLGGEEYSESYSNELYNSDRHKPDDVFTERGLAYDVTVESNSIAASIEAEVSLHEVSYTWEYFEAEVSTAKVSGSISTDITEGFGLNAMAESVAGTAEFSIPIFGHKLKFGVKGNAGSIGAVFLVGARTEIGFASGLGGSVFIEWD